MNTLYGLDNVYGLLMRHSLTNEQIYDVISWLLALHYYDKEGLKTVINASGEAKVNIQNYSKELNDINDFPNEVFLSSNIDQISTTELIEIYRSLTVFCDDISPHSVVSSLFEYLNKERYKIGYNDISSPCFYQLINKLSKNFDKNVTVYDGAQGLGRTLLSVNQDILAVGQDINMEANKYFIRHCIIGQVKSFISHVGDTLSQPGFTNQKQLKTFDYCISEIPFGIRLNDLSKYQNDPFGRYIDDKIPRSASDSLWLQHIVASLNDTGKAFLMIPQGTLFRGGYDAKVRSQLLAKDFIESIIKLPSGCITSTAITPIILVLNKAKSGESKARVLMVDASNKIPSITRKITSKSRNELDELMDKVIVIYNNPVDEKGFSRIVSYLEILENEKKLDPAMYIRIEEEIPLPNFSRAKEDYHESKQRYLEDLEKFNKVFPA